MKSSKQETVYIEVVTKKKGVRDKISLPIDKLVRSTFYCDLINYNSSSLLSSQLSPKLICQRNIMIYPFPQQYIDALPVYINYCHHGHNIKVNVRKLKVCFDLAHYLGDEVFVDVLTNRVFKSWPSSIKVIQSLMDIYQRDIYLRFPFMFIPELYRHESNFVMSWLIKNGKHDIVGPYNLLLSTRVRFCCFNPDHNHSLSRGLTKLVSTIVTGNNKRVYNHGINQEWYEPELIPSNITNNHYQKQQLMSEYTMFYDRQVSIERIWYPCGNIHQIITYDHNGDLVSYKQFDK